MWNSIEGAFREDLEALPLLRYRTRDITRLYLDPCACGRTLVGMDSVKGRSDDMLIVNGVNVFPSQVEHVLTKVDGTTPDLCYSGRKRGVGQA